MEKERIKWQIARNLHLQPVDHRNEIKNILEEVFEALGYKAYEAKNGFRFNLPRELADKILNEYYSESNINELDIIDALNDIKVYIEGYQLKMGYDPIATAEECMKEINLRTGSYDPKVGKWVKEPQKETYKADYTKCKMSKEELVKKYS